MNNFITWLEGQLRDREWTAAQLSRKAKIKGNATINRILSGQRNPGVEVCLKIARALGEPEEKVLRLAGHLTIPVDSQPSSDEKTMIRDIWQAWKNSGNLGSTPPPRPETEPEEIMDVLMLLEDHHRREAFRFIRWLYREQQNPTDSDGVSYRIREAAHQLSVVELMAAFNKLPPDQQIEIIKTLGDFSAADSDQQ